MNKEKKLKLKNSRISILLILICIYISADTLYFGTNSNNSFILFRYYIILILTIILIFNRRLKKEKINIRFFLLVAFLILSMILTMAFYGDYRAGCLIKINLLIFSYLVVEQIDFSRFIQMFIDICFILSILSLIGYIGYYFTPSLFRAAPIIKNSVKTPFYNFVIFNLPKYAEILRDYSIFREPGVFQMYLIICLIFVFFQKRKNEWLYFFVFITCIIITFSTTGYIALIVLIIFYFIATKKNYLSWIFLTICLLGFFIILKQNYNVVFQKLFDINNGSSQARFGSIIINLKLFLQNPVLGIGLTNRLDEFMINSQFLYGNTFDDNTNTILIQFVEYGVIYGIIWIISYWGLAKRILAYDVTMNKMYVIIPFAVFIIIFMFEDVTASTCFTIFSMYGLQEMIKKGKRVYA